MFDATLAINAIKPQTCFHYRACPALVNNETIREVLAPSHSKRDATLFRTSGHANFHDECTFQSHGRIWHSPGHCLAIGHDRASGDVPDRRYQFEAPLLGHPYIQAHVSLRGEGRKMHGTLPRPGASTCPSRAKPRNHP